MSWGTDATLLRLPITPLTTGGSADARDRQERLLQGSTVLLDCSPRIPHSDSMTMGGKSGGCVANELGETREYERKCQRCASVWYIPESLHDEEAPSRLEVRGAKMQLAGKKMTPFIGWLFVRRSERQLEQYAEQTRRLTERDRCPSCGSVAFQETKMWASASSKFFDAMKRLAVGAWRLTIKVAKFAVAEMRRRREVSRVPRDKTD